MFVNLEMEMKRLGRYIVLVLVLIILVVCQVKAIVDIQNRPSSPSVDTTENLVELLWANCGLDMKYLKEAYNSADSRIIRTSATNMLKEENLMKLLSVLPRKNQAVILDCLKEKAPVSLLSEDDESSPGWYLKFIDSLVSNFYRPAQYRRHLADENAVASDSEVESINVAIVISVVVTAIVTFIFALLLFLFCHKHLGINISKYYENDKPLLGISTSDYSTGSTNSPDFQNSSHKMSFQSCCSTISDKEQATSSEENVESDVVNVSVDRADTLPAEETLSIDSKIPPQPINSPPEKILPPPKLPPSKALPEPPPPPASPCAPAPPPPPPPRRQSSGGGSPSPPGPPPPPVVGSKPGVCPPPLPKGVVQPPAPPNVGSTNSSRTKLKPFFWDKVLTHPGHAMVWNQIKAGSFQFNEEMIETLFGYVPPDKNKMFPHKESSAHDAPKFIQLIDRKKEQNLSILMRALNITTEEVCDALEHGNELPPEFLETLLKMAPTPEEELKLRLFSGELSQLGPTERFLKVLVDIPYAIQRMEALHFMCTLEEEVKTIKESFLTLEAACNELRDNRLFLKLLEAVLKTGNRMNDGTFRGGAQAFKLDTLLKLSDVKGVDGKITLLHFVVTEIIRSEGIRAARGDGTNTSFSSAKSIYNFIDDQSEDDFEEKLRTLGLQVVSHLSREMEDVKKAAGLDGEILSASVAKLGRSMTKTRNFLNLGMKNIDEENGFHQVLKCFVEEIDDSVMLLVEEEKRIVEVMKSTADYFHGKPTKEEGLRLFSIVKDFLVMLDKACAQIAEQFTKSSNSCSQSHKKDSLSGKSSSDEQPPSKESPPKQNYTDTPLQLPPDVRQRFMKAIPRGQEDVDSSSEDEDD